MQTITFQSIFDTPTVAQSTLNQLSQTPDGRIFEYLKTTEAVTQYMTVSNPANSSQSTVSSSTNANSEIVFITQSGASFTVNDFADEWLIVDTGTGEGQTAKIKGNTVDTIELYADYAFATALDVASSGIVIRQTTVVEKVAITVLITPVKGVAQVTFASGDFGWFLKRGIGGCLAGEVITINVSATPGDDTEGTLEIGDTAKGDFDENTVARCLVANTSADKAFLGDVSVI